MAEFERNAHLGVAGSSAGGMEALSGPVFALPEGFPAPVVLVQQHLGPDREGRPEEALSRRSFTENELLVPGGVRVVPS